MRWRTRLLRLCRNKAKGPLFTVFFMSCVLIVLSIIQTFLSGGFQREISDDDAFRGLADFEELLSEGAEGMLDSRVAALRSGLDNFGDTDPEEDHYSEVLDFEGNAKVSSDAIAGSDDDLDGRDVSVDSNLTCTTHVMFLAESQLGNLMVKYAVLYAFREKFGAKVYLFPKQHRFATKMFTHLSIKQVPDELKTKDWRPVSFEDIMYMLPCNKYVTEEEFLIVTDWPEDNGVKLYAEYAADIRADFHFVPAIRTRARRYTERFRSSPNTTLVGIHLRRGDHILHTWLRHRRKVPDLEYFTKSMEYFANMFPGVRFVAASDDRRYLMNKLVPAAPFQIYTIDSLDQVHDMALLAACDHTIISVGTFGLFTGLLAGGSVVAAARNPGTRGDPFDIQVNPPGQITDVFLWN